MSEPSAASARAARDRPAPVAAGAGAAAAGAGSPGASRGTPATAVAAGGDPIPGGPTFTWGAGRRRIVLHQGDCIGGMRRLLAPDSVDVVVTSPPYNLGIAYGRYDDAVPRAQYLDWIEHWALAVRRVLRPAGSLFLNIGGKPADPWGPLDVLLRLRPHFVLQNTLHWVKSIALDVDPQGTEASHGRALTVGHYKPINSTRYVNDCHEYVFHLTKTGAVPLDRLAIGVEYQDKSNVRRWRRARGDRRCRGNTWFIPYETIQSRQRQRPHPATFPVRLPLMCIRLHGLERAQHVLDPFLGLGSTALACRALGIRCTGFELDPSYWAVACQRVRSATAGSIAAGALSAAPHLPSSEPG